MSSRGCRDVGVGVEATGFGDAPAVAAAAAASLGGLDTQAPAGGWPTLSVIVVGPASKDVKKNALAQLALQDYPLDRLVEVVISGASDLAASAPGSLGGVMRDFRLGSSDKNSDRLHLLEELEACTGDFVAIWGDDHVSPASRLKAQVSAASRDKAPNVLKQKWFFDPEEYKFSRVTRWPTDEFEEQMSRASNGATLAAGFGPVMVTSDALTLCSQRDLLVEASKAVQAAVSPSDGLKELLLKLLGARPPTILDGLEWAVLRAAPSVASSEIAMPNGAIVRMAQEALPRAKAGKSALEDALKEIQDEKLPPVAAVQRLLEFTVSKELSAFDLKRVTKVIRDSLKRSPGRDTSASLQLLVGWDGLRVGGGDALAVKKFPLFYAIYVAFRSYVTEEADMVDVGVLGEIAQGFVMLAKKMWGADNDITEAVVKITAQELFREGSSTSRIASRTADHCGTLGMRRPLEAIAYAVVDTPEEAFKTGGSLNVQQLSLLAWGLAEGGVENGALQIKVAKGIINNADKLQPPDIGYLFTAMHERKWFKDSEVIKYLAQSLVARAQELKRNNPSLAKALANGVAPAAA